MLSVHTLWWLQKLLLLRSIFLSRVFVSQPKRSSWMDITRATWKVLRNFISDHTLWTVVHCTKRGIDYPCCVFVGDLSPNCCTILFRSHRYWRSETGGQSADSVPFLRIATEFVMHRLWGRLVAFHTQHTTKHESTRVCVCWHTAWYVFVCGIEWPMMISNALELLRKNSAGKHIH